MSRKEEISNFGIYSKARFSVLQLFHSRLRASASIDRYGLPRILELLRALGAGQPFDTAAADLLAP